MTRSFQKLEETWTTLGREDPLWAVYSDPAKRAGKWDPEEFYRTGERDVAAFHDILKAKAACPAHLESVLDFGCGVGRLSAAWARRAQQVTGVDVSQPMLAYAQDYLRDLPNLRLVHNPREDLSIFSSGSFDLVFSLICLQHMPWEVAKNYIVEFARVARPQSLVAFQLPAQPVTPSRLAHLRKRLVDALPSGLAEKYRTWRHGSSVAFEMFYTRSDLVEECARTAGLSLVGKERDQSCGAETISYFYIFRKNG